MQAKFTDGYKYPRGYVRSESTDVAAAALCLSLLAGCETATSGGAAGGQRSQLMLVSSEQQIEALLPTVMPLYQAAHQRR